MTDHKLSPAFFCRGEWYYTKAAAEAARSADVAAKAAAEAARSADVAAKAAAEATAQVAAPAFFCRGKWYYAKAAAEAARSAEAAAKSLRQKPPAKASGKITR